MQAATQKCPTIFSNPESQQYVSQLFEHIQRTNQTAFQLRREPEAAKLGCYDPNSDSVNLYMNGVTGTVNSYYEKGHPFRGTFSQMVVAYTLAHEYTHAHHWQASMQERHDSPQRDGSAHSRIFAMIQEIPLEVRRQLVQRPIPMNYLNDMPDSIKDTPLGQRMGGR